MVGYYIESPLKRATSVSCIWEEPKATRLTEGPVRSLTGLRRVSSVPNLTLKTFNVTPKYLPGYSNYRSYGNWSFWDEFWYDRTFYHKPFYDSLWSYSYVPGRKYVFDYTKYRQSSTYPIRISPVSDRYLYEDPYQTRVGRYHGSSYYYWPRGRYTTAWDYETNAVDRGLDMYKSHRITADSLNKYWLRPTFGPRRYKDLYSYYDSYFGY